MSESILGIEFDLIGDLPMLGTAGTPPDGDAASGVSMEVFQTGVAGQLAPAPSGGTEPAAPEPPADTGAETAAPVLTVLSTTATVPASATRIESGALSSAGAGTEAPPVVPVETDTAGVITVSSAEELAEALQAATGGETIRLAAGDYGDFTLSAVFDKPVTIVAETPGAARFTGLDVESSANVILDGLHLDYDSRSGQPGYLTFFTVQDSQGITWRNSLFEGDDMQGTGTEGDGYPAGRGIKIGGSSDILFENNEFRTFWKAVGVGGSENVILRGNEIHDIRSDGINITTSDGVIVEGNHIHDFRGNAATGDHADMIQVFSGASPLIPKNITIRDNYLDIGSGSHTQSIWISHSATAERTHGADVAFENIAVTGNVIVNGRMQGIILSTTHGAVISGNTVIAPPGEGYVQPRIGVAKSSTGVTMTDNIVQGFYNMGEGDVPADWLVTNNFKVQFDNPDLPLHYSDVFVNAMSGATHAPENLQLLPDSAPALAGAGAPMLVYDGTPPVLTALAHPEPGDWLNEIVFDAGFSAGPDGAALASGARFLWDFGDGSTGEGAMATHRYTAPGRYMAELTVILPDGSRDSIQVRADIAGADIISFDPVTGLLVVGQYGETRTVAMPSEMDQLLRGTADAAGDAARFSADTMIKLSGEVVTALESAGSMTMTATIKAEAGGNLLNLHGSFNLAIGAGGELVAEIGGTKVTTRGADLLDGGWHDIALRFDGRAGGNGLELVVDGEVLASAALEGSLRADVGHDLKLGAKQFGDGGFTGEIRAFDLDANPLVYDMTPLADPEIPEPEPVAHLEAGTATVSQAHDNQWHRVDFAGTIDDARVVMGPLSSNGSDPAVVRVRHVTETGFEFKIDEWDYLDGRHVAETVSWVAASAGSYTLATGARITFGQSLLKDGDLTGVNLDGFGAGMSAFAQITSVNGRQTVTARLSDVTAKGFSLAMQEQESLNDGHHAETVDWIAVAQSVTARGIADHRGLGLTLGGDVDDFAFLASMQSSNDADTAALRHAETQGGLIVRIEEERSADHEISHGFEELAVFALESGRHDLFDWA